MQAAVCKALQKNISPLLLPSPTTESEATHASGTTPSWSVVRNTKLAATPQSDRNPDESKNEGNILTSKVVPVAPSPVVPICSTLETQRSATKKRARASPSKKTAKKLFVNDDAKIDGGDDCAGADEPRSGEDDA